MGYLKKHIKSGIKVGDTVKVTRIAEDNENGWGSKWNSMGHMDCYVGKKHTVIGDGEKLGFELESIKGGHSFYFPYFVLKKVNPKKAVKKKIHEYIEKNIYFDEDKKPLKKIVSMILKEL